MVISADENRYFSTGGLKRSHSGKFSTSSRQSIANLPAQHHSPNTLRIPSPPQSPPSSEESSPRTIFADSIAPSYQSTPASSISLDHRREDDEDDDEGQIAFPSYDAVAYMDDIEDLEPPASLRGDGGSYTVSSASNTVSTDASRPDSPELIEHAEDDTAIRTQPSRHVDYLSHNWREEDIWSSWQHIVSRRGTYSNSARLENASWRTWIKNKYQLKTVSPETLNWLKDCDVTWLYGPLQTGAGKPFCMPAASPVSSRISKSNSFLHKKPILKKRSMSEIMLQRSLSASSLLKQAAAAVQAQQASVDRPAMGRATSDYVAFPFASRRMSRENTSALPSISSSGIESPICEKKHIHFNEQVEQCIALDIKGDDEDEVEVYTADTSDSDSDDGAIMMKSSKRSLPPIGTKRTTPRNDSFNNESKTIAMLPSTTLKYREDTPEPQETAMKHGGFWKLSPSPSEETLRPSKPSRQFLLADDDDDDDDINWQPPTGLGNRRDSIAVTQERMSGLQVSGGLSADDAGPSGMRRTPSGMFMPYEEDEDDVVSEGLFGKMVDTVNTAKDIAHVIWNVGWKR